MYVCIKQREKDIFGGGLEDIVFLCDDGKEQNNMKMKQKHRLPVCICTYTHTEKIKNTIFLCVVHIYSQCFLKEFCLCVLNSIGKKNSEKIIVKNLFIYGRMDFGFRPKTADMMTMIMFIGKQIRNHGMVAAAHDGNILKITSPQASKIVEGLNCTQKQ